MDNSELLINNQVHKENEIQQVEKELADNKVIADQKNLIAQQQKDNQVAIKEVAIENININSMVEQKVSKAELSDSLILDEQPAYVEKALTPELDEQEIRIYESIPRPIKMSRMKRFSRKIGFGNEKERAEYETYLSRKAEIKHKKELLQHVEVLRQKQLAGYKKMTEEKVNLIKSFGKRQGSAFNWLGKLNRKGNSFLKRMQDQGDEDNIKIDAEGKKALLCYKAETKGHGLDFGPMNILLRSNKLSAQFIGINKTCKKVCDETKKELKMKKNQEFNNAQLWKLRNKQSECKDTVNATKAALKSMNKFSLREDMTLYRHTGLAALASMLGLNSNASEGEIDRCLLRVGRKEMLIRDKGFVSTSMFLDSANHFRHTNPVHFIILGHKGTKAVNISRLAKLDKDNKPVGITSVQDKEQEMLLQSGTQFRILKVETDDAPMSDRETMKSTKEYTIYVETIPQVEKAS